VEEKWIRLTALRSSSALQLAIVHVSTSLYHVTVWKKHFFFFLSLNLQAAAMAFLVTASKLRVTPKGVRISASGTVAIELSV
jgi:hypothetical protein